MVQKGVGTLVSDKEANQSILNKRYETGGHIDSHVCEPPNIPQSSINWSHCTTVVTRYLLVSLIVVGREAKNE